MTLPSIRRHPPDPVIHRQLADWMAEWAMLLAIENDGELSAPPAAPAPVHLHISDDAAPIQQGDIRLLHPEIEPTALRYIAVVAPHSATEWIVVPFGLLSEPATPDEIRTNRTAPPLRVLCPWNRLPLATARLERCWLVDQLTGEESAWLRAALSTDGATPPLPRERIGPPLRHPLDPRREYLARETAFRQRLRAANTPQTRYDVRSASELLKAAEDHTPYGHTNRDTPPNGEMPGD